MKTFNKEDSESVALYAARSVYLLIKAAKIHGGGTVGAIGIDFEHFAATAFESFNLGPALKKVLLSFEPHDYLTVDAIVRGYPLMPLKTGSWFPLPTERKRENVTERKEDQTRKGKPAARKARTPQK